MSYVYAVNGTSDIFTPALLVFEDVLRDNIGQMIQIAGDPSSLRSHCKTHKIREVTEIEIEFGILKHKCATFAEAEVLALAGAKYDFLAYNPRRSQRRSSRQVPRKISGCHILSDG